MAAIMNAIETNASTKDAPQDPDKKKALAATLQVFGKMAELY